MKMKSHSEEKSKERLAENKLVILYLLKKANCTLTNLQMLRFLYDFEDFNYYYFQHLLSELIAQGYIVNYQQGEEWLYEISMQGKEILELTENILPGIMKQKIDIVTKNMLWKVKNEMAVTAEYIPENNNEYRLKCKITESHQVLFELNILSTSQEQAKKMAEQWKKGANQYYPAIIEMLTQENSNTKP